jgi:tetratricopeptide (TPR) repeat protein
MVSGTACALSACAMFVTEPRPDLSLAPAPTEQTLAEARTLFDLDNPGLALLRVEAYLAVAPNSTAAHNLAGAIYDRIGRHELAQRHYEAALALDADYLPAVNNYGLSKLQRAQANARLDLAQEAEALLARAVTLSGEPERLSKSHQAVRAELARKIMASAPATKPPAPRPHVWLERRGVAYTFVVTKPSFAAVEAAALNLDPGLALVSPGASSPASRIVLAPKQARQLSARFAAVAATPRVIRASSGLSILSIASKRKPKWYRGSPAEIAAPLLPAEQALSMRTAALLNVKVLP